ncbi:hypothetical protein INT47_004336 [Mucor saturninus]|uniref:Uncharacterized protein n=1 Tax=Mucor saturninus TaxID=64648 RepID=A0A8H7QTS2_9FUNG|nr:hypothetical protein INT47_004336 [Mucor saturninus]
MPVSEEAAPHKNYFAFILSSYESASENSEETPSEENPSEEKPSNEKCRLVPRRFILFPNPSMDFKSISLKLSAICLFLSISKPNRYKEQLGVFCRVFNFAKLRFQVWRDWGYVEIIKKREAAGELITITIQVAYLDGWIISAISAEQAAQKTQLVIQKLASLGWIVNFSKSSLTPQQSIEHLGFVLNTNTITAQLPGKKLRDLRRSIQQVLNNPLQSARTIHTFDEDEEPECKLIERLGQDTGNTKGMHRGVTLVEKQSTSMEWEKYTTANTTADHIRRCQQHGLGMQHETSKSAEQTAFRHWTYEEASMSINWRELKAAFLRYKHSRN